MDIAHATINGLGRFMDRLARMKATIGYGASCNRVFPASEKFDQIPCSPATRSSNEAGDFCLWHQPDLETASAIWALLEVKADIIGSL